MIYLTQLVAFKASQINWVDYLLVALIAVYLRVGFARGFVKEIHSLLSLSFALALALSLASELASLLVSYGASRSSAPAMAFIALLAVARAASSFVFFLLNEDNLLRPVSGFGHFSGMLTGLIRGVVVCEAIIFFCGLTSVPRDHWWRQSRLIPKLQASTHWLSRPLPTTLALNVDFG